MRLDQGETKNYSESYRKIELAITDTTDPKFDDVVAIPESPLARKETIQHPKLPFRVAVRTYLPNATLRETTGGAAAPAGPATQGVGPQVLVNPQPLTFKQDERNIPSAYVELTGPDGPLGTWLVSPAARSATLSATPAARGRSRCGSRGTTSPFRSRSSSSATIATPAPRSRRIFPAASA